MPGEAPGRGPGPVAVERTVRLLACEVRIAVDCPQVVAWLDTAAASATQSHPVSRRHRLEIARAEGGYRIREDGVEHHIAGTPEAAGEAVVGRLHALAFAAVADQTKVHAGCATWRGKRLLVVGPGRSGKSTLMTRLLYEGFSVHGDEMVLLKEGRATAYPRRFGIRQPTLRLVPQLAAAAPEHAGAESTHGYHVLALDPGRLGFDWRIEPGPVDAVFFLEARHRGATALRPCPRYLMAQRMMSQSTPPNTGRRAWIRDVCEIVDHAECYTLALGDLDRAVAEIRRTMVGDRMAAEFPESSAPVL